MPVFLGKRSSTFTGGTGGERVISIPVHVPPVERRREGGTNDGIHLFDFSDLLCCYIGLLTVQTPYN